MGLAWYGAAQLAGAFLAQQPLAASGVQAALAEWASGSLGIAWSDPTAAPPTARAVTRRASMGAALGFGAAALLIGVAVGTRAATLAPGRPSLAALFLGLLESSFVAVRDELFLRGLVLRVIDGGGRRARVVGLAACGLASAAAVLGATESGVPATTLLAAAMSGIAFGALWMRDRGAWMAAGAHATWLWATTSLARGALLDVRVVKLAWAGASSEIDGGPCAVLVLGALALAASAAALRRSTPLGAA